MTNDFKNNNLEKSKLKELVGSDFTDAELDQILVEYNKLSGEANNLAQRLDQFRQQPLPPLSVNFTGKVLSQLSTNNRLKYRWKSWITFPRFFKYTTAIAGFTILLFVVKPLFRNPIPSGLQVLEEKIGTNQEKSYLVRFAIQSPGAKEINLLGDFNGWQGMALKKSKDDVFYGELSLNQGTYAYGFMVDGKAWIFDPSNPFQVEDGFGQYNSIVNL